MDVDDPPLEVPPYADLLAKYGPGQRPYTHIGLGMVVWNEEERLPALLEHLRPWFERIVVGVQHSTDGTVDIARRWADIVVYDAHRGFGDATFGPRVLPHINTRWTFKVDADEWPNADLLASLSVCAATMRELGRQGAWVPFRSSIEGNEYTEQHSHLRLFQTLLGWPNTLHSRPMTGNTIFWREGFVRHDRSLDEMIQDYLRYWAVGRGHQQWDDHNRLMLHDACTSVASTKGWDFVQSFTWWPQVEAIAFLEEKPWRLP